MVHDKHRYYFIGNLFHIVSILDVWFDKSNQNDLEYAAHDKNEKL